MNNGSHWYRHDGSACFEVPNKSKPGMRPVKITDARELKLLPSVTTVLSVLDKPQLSDWKHRQITRWCFDNPGAHADYEQFHRLAVDGAFQQVEDAADLGTRVHKALEQHFQGAAYDPSLEVYVKATDQWMRENGVKLLQQELRLTSVSHGYAGTTDAVMVSLRGTGILDFKTRKTVPGKPCTPWDTQPMQIAAYDVAKYGNRPEVGRVGCNCFISTTEPGRVEAAWYDHEQLNREWDAFAAALALWRHLKGYDPRLLS